MISSRLLPNQKTNLSHLVTQHVKNLRKDGDEWSGLCPFCNGGYKREEKFYIDMDSGLSICHRAVKCGWKGNALGFVTELLDVSYEQARRFLDQGRDGTPEYLMSLLESIEREPEEPLTDEVWI